MNRLYSDSGYVMQIQNFSVNDGDGIRTTIFLGGCPLRCIWCCNPENFFMEDSNLKSVGELDRIIARQALFYRGCKGGITFSGGEATMQQGFLRSLCENFYDKGYSLELETCGVFVYEEVEDILSKMDRIFIDLKIFDEDEHKLFTGASNAIIKENIKKLSQLKVPVVVRIPVIVGVNAYDSNFIDTADFIRNNHKKACIELLPYHRFGMDKYSKLKLPSPDEQYRRLLKSEGCMEIPSDDMLLHFKQLIMDKGVELISFK